MRIFLTRVFARFAAKERLSDGALREAVKRAESGLVDADLGGGVIKQRVARPGAGKSGGYRTIILFRRGTRAVFVHGFAKKDKDNVDISELRYFRKLSADMLRLSDLEMEAAVAAKLMKEIQADD